MKKYERKKKIGREKSRSMIEGKTAVIRKCKSRRKNRNEKRKKAKELKLCSANRKSERRNEVKNG